MAIKGVKAATISQNAGLSINTFGKFLRGEIKSMKWATLEAICKEIGISNAAVLDADNPFSDAKNRLYEHINQMSEDEAEAELRRIESERSILDPSDPTA